MKLRDKKGPFTVRMSVGGDVFVLCDYMKTVHYRRNTLTGTTEWLCQLMQIRVVVGGIIVSNHQTGGGELWMNQDISVMDA